MQKLARHSTVELTIGRYTHANLNDFGDAVRQMAPLPLLESPDSKIANAEPAKNDSEMVALMVAGVGDNHRQSLMTVDESAVRATGDSHPNADSRNPQSTMTLKEDCGCLMAIDRAEREGFEPSVPLRVHWLSRPAHSAALSPLRRSGSRHSRLPTKGADDSGRFVETPSDGIGESRSHSCECNVHEIQLGCGASQTDSAPAWAVDLIDFQDVLRPRVKGWAGLEAVAIFW